LDNNTPSLPISKDLQKNNDSGMLAKDKKIDPKN
jgi:hypothetical protein